MVMRYGMSDKLGPRTFGHNHAQPFLGREFSQEPDYSEEIAQEIDQEINRIIEAAHTQARDILVQHKEQLDTITNILVEYETLEKAEFEALLDGVPAEEVFKDKDMGKPEPVVEEKSHRRVTEKKKEPQTDVLPKEPPLESPSY